MDSIGIVNCGSNPVFCATPLSVWNVLPKDNLEVDADKKEKEDKSNKTNKKENN